MFLRHGYFSRGKGEAWVFFPDKQGGLKPSTVNLKGVYSKEQQASLPQMETLFLGCEESQGRKERDATGHWHGAVTSQDCTPSLEREGSPLVGSRVYLRRKVGTRQRRGSSQ